MGGGSGRRAGAAPVAAPLVCGQLCAPWQPLPAPRRPGRPGRSAHLLPQVATARAGRATPSRGHAHSGRLGAPGGEPWAPGALGRRVLRARRLWACPQVLQSEPGVGGVYLRMICLCLGVSLSAPVVPLCLAVLEGYLPVCAHLPSCSLDVPGF